ncbi:inositol monophosphatase family protein [Kineosporia babensis]|uniref:3'(2'),5'-bisphosphate nucleotidase CysQ n=1 Tax=Kineosporia babensis TaxID=499548 RepID=A0A9X1SW81_9ACTN|nr:inositol monophosphatase family protein [Kineosporia babensis]MCD5314772.1 3'(2'),5'-bisphosphate nucleotidase CysQ [Kineosporia babensis]
MSEQELLAVITGAVRRAGGVMQERAKAFTLPTTSEDLINVVKANDAAVTEILRPALMQALPDASWEADEHAKGPVPAGDLWVTDPVGGNVNAVHGIPEWNIGVTLVRDGRPLIAVVYIPLTDELFTAVAGEGARLNGTPLQVSAKTELSAALAGTGQALPSQEPAAAQRAGQSIAAMMRSALLVRAAVPVTQQLVQLAAGRLDLHWQFDNVRSHIGPLLIFRESGGRVTHLDGRDWEIAGEGYLAAAPGLHAAALNVLRKAA